MNNLTNVKIALIAAVASLFTSSVSAGIQAVFLYHKSAVADVFGFMLGRTIGESPIALVCYGIVYGWLHLRKAK